LRGLQLSEFGPFVAGLKQTWSRLGDAKKGAFGVVAVVILAIPLLWLVDRIVLFLFAKSYIAEIADVFNIDQHMARAMALILWVIIIFFVSKLFSISHANRRIGFYGLLFLLVSQALLLSYGTKDHFFKPSSGEPTKCYVLSREGEVRYLEHAGVDPVTGRVCRTYTQETAERLRAYAGGKRPERILSSEVDFFDLRTGEPIVWFYRDKDGAIELFNLMGFHPESGEELQPVNTDIIKAYKAQAHRRISPPRRIKDIEEFELFDTATGQPRAWFWKGKNGKYEFFDNQGFHPANGEVLKRFTSEEIARWKQEKELLREYEEQEARKRLEEAQLRKDAEERRLAREREAVEKAERTEAEKQRALTEAADSCDKLAANPHDPRKPLNVLGSKFAEVQENAAEAALACRRAVEYFPNEPRYKYQYARALGFTKAAEAILIYRRLTKELYPAAFDNLASLLLQKRDKKSIAEAISVLKNGVRNGDSDSMVTLAALVGTSMYPVSNPYAYKLALYKQAASLGHQEAGEAAVEMERQAEQQQLEYVSRRQQEQMMLELFGTLLGGALRGH
jgi:hypothetical protein